MGVFFKGTRFFCLFVAVRRIFLAWCCRVLVFFVYFCTDKETSLYYDSETIIYFFGK